MRKSPFFALIKRELFSYALNPAIYISTLVFLVACAINFFYTNRFFIEGIGSTDMRYFFAFMPYISILCIPALTMGLWANEEGVSDSLPITSTMLICAKWLASTIVFSITVLISLAVPLAASVFGTIELSIIVTATIGILLFGTALCAFGQLSALVLRNQAASFFVTAIILTLFNVSHIVPLTFTLPSWLSKLCNFVSFSWHFDSSAKGIFDTSDLLFYIILTALFLIISVFVCENRKYGLNKQIIAKKHLRTQYVGLIFVALMLLWNSQVFYTRFDASENQRFSLSDFSKKLTDSLDGNLSITYYVSPELQDVYPQVRDVQDFLFSYANYSPNISVNVLDPIKNDRQEALEAIGVIGQNIPTIEGNRTSILTVYSAVVLEYLDYTEVIPLVLDTNSLEFDMAGRLQSITGQFSRSAFLLVGSDLSLATDYPYIQPWLESAGFAVRELQASDILNTARLDTRTPLVILGSSNLSPQHTAAVDSFIEAGGSVFFSVSPIDMNIDEWITRSNQDIFIENTEQIETIIQADSIIGLLERYGIKMQTALIHDASNMSVQMLVDSQTANSAANPEHIQYPFFINIQSGHVSENHPLSAGFSGLSLFWPSPISINQVDNHRANVIAHTSAQSWLQEPNIILLEQGESPFITDPFFEDNLRPDTSSQQAYPIAATLQLGDANSTSSPRLLAVADQYFLSRAIGYVDTANGGRNFDFLVNALLWLQHEDDLLAIRAKTHTDYTLTKIQDSTVFATTQKSTMTALFAFFALVCLAPYMCVILTRRTYSKNLSKKAGKN